MLLLEESAEKSNLNISTLQPRDTIHYTDLKITML